MANVYGTPITDSTLKGMPDYIGKQITQADRAKVARDMKEAESKHVNVTTYVENLKKDYGNGISVLCTIYNATGDDLTFLMSHDWYGHIGSKPYPQTIKNGQWGGFLHVHPTSQAYGAIGTVVYRGRNAEGRDCGWCVAWNDPYIGANTSYAEARDANHYDSNGNWGGLESLLYKSKMDHTDKWNGCQSSVIIGEGTSPTLEATFTLTH